MSECDLNSVCVQKQQKFSGAACRHSKTRASASDVEKPALRWEDAPRKSVPTCSHSHHAQYSCWIIGFEL